MQPVAPQDGSILILFFGDLGDTLLAVPAVRSLRTRFPESRFTMLGKAASGRILVDLELVDEVLDVDKHFFDKPAALLKPRAWFLLLKLLVRLRRENCDTVVVLQHLVTNWGAVKVGLLALASGAKRRVGINNGRGWFFTSSVRDRGFGDRHEAQYYLDVASLLGAFGPLQSAVRVTDADRHDADDLLKPAGPSRRLLAIHPGTGWYGPGRRWDPVAFAQAAQLILRQEDMTCVVVGTNQESSETARVVAELGDRGVDLSGRTTVGQLAAVLSRCELLLANDGGVGHLAAAVGTPVISVFGPSNDRAWRPLLGRVVAADLACRPCFYRDYGTGSPSGFPNRECMMVVTPDMVAGAALEVIGERQPTNSAG